MNLRKNNHIAAIQLNEIVNLLEQKAGKTDFYNEFCDTFLLSNNNNNNMEIYTLYDFMNFTNLAHFKTFLNNILENILLSLNNKNKESYSLLDKIFIIGEKTLFENTFLCSLLNKNKIFNNINIWENCIKYKVIDSLIEICNQYISIGLFNKGKNLYNKGSKFIGVFLGFEDKKVTKKDNIIEYLELNKDLPMYND